MSDEQSSAVRGHLRQCEACEHLFEQEVALLDATANLASLEPPDRIWDAISQQIAEAEMADSDRRAWRRWMREHSVLLGAAGVAMAVAVAALLLLRADAGTSSKPDEALVAAQTVGALPASMDMGPGTVTQQQERALSEADRDYQQTIEELRVLLEEDRPGWSAQESSAVDARLAGFRRAAIEKRFAIADQPVLVSSRDPIYASYRAEISFLQAVLVGDLPLDEGQP